MSDDHRVRPSARFAVALPPPREDGPVSVERAIGVRRTVRSFAAGGLTLAEIAQLLWAAQGITGTEGRRAAPSAGALYPLEAYLFAGKVVKLPAGLYRYDGGRHDLTLHREGDLRPDLAAAALDQEWLGRAPAVVALCAFHGRTMARYGPRGRRYVDMEAGHAAQNLGLQAVAMDLVTGIVGAFEDDEVAGLMGLAADEVPLYLLPVGRPGGDDDVR
ncbi:MAG: SagB/ThcOx family dehydrogenase [Rhodospirillales bacterium]|nr:SagB/ThcOx family dehydrogenase [Rhodospirillales bacterium]